MSDGQFAAPGDPAAFSSMLSPCPVKAYVGKYDSMMGRSDNSSSVNKVGRKPWTPMLIVKYGGVGATLCCKRKASEGN